MQIEVRGPGGDAQADPENKVPFFQAVVKTVQLGWRASPGYMLVVVFITFITALIPPRIVELGRDLVDGVLEARVAPPGTGREAVVLTVVFLGGLTALQTILGTLSGTRGHIFQQRVRMEAEEEFLFSVSHADAGHFDDPSWHDRVERANRSLYRSTNLLQNTFSIGGSLITVLLMLRILLDLDPLLLGLALIAVLVPLPIERRINRQLYAMRWERTPEERERTFYSQALSEPEMAKDLRAFNLEDHFLIRHRGVVAMLHQRLIDLFAKANRNTLLIGILSGAALAGAYGFAGSQGLVGELSPGDMTAVIGAVASIIGQMTGISSGLLRMDEDTKFMGDFYDFLDLETLVPVAKEPASIPTEIAEGIHFDNVEFSYPGVPERALKGLTLNVRPGELMALVGDNGAGKTTLVKLLLRFYDTQGGSVRFNRLDLKDVDPHELRERIGVLFQDPLELALSVRENVTFGRPSAEQDDEKVWRALEGAKIAGLVRELPNGLDSKMGRLFEGGKDLSGGEWRRLAIARLMFRSADVWVLDEPTSSLDPEAEAGIFSELKENLHGRTGIVISHRFNTVRIADRIAVIEDGRVAELGTHEELVALGGKYSHLFSLQAEAYL